jgi:SPP1 gp7 family putative phage head morphogenesis protein
MTITCQHTEILTNTYDPTRTTRLRNAMVKELRRRFRELKQLIKTAIVDKDCFGLAPTHYQMTPPVDRQFAFSRSADKVAAFMEWLQGQVDAGLLEVRELRQVGKSVNAAWSNRYIFDSYKRGVIRARYETEKAGYKVPTIEQTGGIEISMATPFHVDRLGLLYTRMYTELKGTVTEMMDKQISRVLSQGIADGDNPRLLAKKLVATIDGTGLGELGLTDKLGRFIPAERRSEIIARTEIIRAHHVATIQEYRNWAVEGVMVKGEWKTAGDDRVCDDCAEMEGHIFSLDEIEGMIPKHSQCRCVALPYLNKET